MPTILWSDFSTLGLRRPWPLIRGIADQWAFRMQLRSLQKRLAGFQPTRIFALAGADPYFLDIATHLASAMRIPLDLYLVDDFAESAIAAGDRMTLAWIHRNERRLLNSASKLWVISEGFAEHLQLKHGIESSVLPVAMPAQEVNIRSENPLNSRAIVFVGSVNHLYIDALVEVYNCLHDINLESVDSPYRLVIYTLGYPRVLMDRIGDSRFLELHIARSDEERTAALECAHAVLLPYSFSEDAKLMVSTSFSCKTGEALSSGRPVLVYGPPYASVPRHFLKHDLPLVVTSEGLLRDAILGIPQIDNAGLIERYQKVSEELHHPEAVLRVLEASTFRRKI